jgi:hypothetical protein
MLLTVTTDMPFLSCVLFWVWYQLPMGALVGVVKDDMLCLYLYKFSGISDFTYVCMFVMGFSMWLEVFTFILQVADRMYINV